MSCVFCGTPPRDGEPCCTWEFKRNTMRHADAKAKRLERRVADLESERTETLMLAGEMSSLRELAERWFEAATHRATAERRVADLALIVTRTCTWRSQAELMMGVLGHWELKLFGENPDETEILELAKDGTGLPILTDEARRALEAKP